MSHPLLRVVIAIKVDDLHVIDAVLFKFAGKHHVPQRIMDIVHHHIEERRRLFNKKLLRYQCTAACRPGLEHVSYAALNPNAAVRLHAYTGGDLISLVEIDAADVFSQDIRIFFNDTHRILAVYLVNADSLAHLNAEFPQFYRRIREFSRFIK